MSSLLGFHILCTVSIVYGLDIRCYICNSVDHPDCGIDGSRLIADLNSTFLRPCIKRNSVCSLSYKMTRAELTDATRRHSYTRNCVTRDEKANLQSSFEIVASEAGTADMVLLKDLSAGNTKLRMYFCEFSGCNYRYPESELEQQQQFSISCYQCSSTSSDDPRCGLVLSADEAVRVLTACPNNYLQCLSSYREDTNSLARFDFNRSCVSETEVTLLKRICGKELVGFAADSSEQIHYFICDNPGCNDVISGSNITAISCFTCNESTTICSDIDGRMFGTEAGKHLLRPCPTEEPHHCSIMILYDSKKGLATKIDRQCMLARLVKVYQQSGGEAQIIRTSDPSEAFYMSFCRTTGCNRAYGRPGLLKKPTTHMSPDPTTFGVELDMQKSSTDHIGVVSLPALLVLIGIVCTL